MNKLKNIILMLGLCGIATSSGASTEDFAGRSSALFRLIGFEGPVIGPFGNNIFDFYQLVSVDMDDGTGKRFWLINGKLCDLVDVDGNLINDAQSYATARVPELDDMGQERSGLILPTLTYIYISDASILPDHEGLCHTARLMDIGCDWTRIGSTFSPNYPELFLGAKVLRTHDNESLDKFLGNVVDILNKLKGQTADGGLTPQFSFMRNLTNPARVEILSVATAQLVDSRLQQECARKVKGLIEAIEKEDTPRLRWCDYSVIKLWIESILNDNPAPVEPL